MYTPEEILKTASEFDIECFRVEIDAFMGDETHNVFFASDDLKEVFYYAKKCNESTVLYGYCYYSESEYSISEDDIEENAGSYIDSDSSLCKYIASQAAKYNKKTANLDYTRPSILLVICLHQGFSVASSSFDFWLDKLDVPKKDDALQKILDSEEVDELRSKLREAKYKKIVIKSKSYTTISLQIQSSKNAQTRI